MNPLGARVLMGIEDDFLLLHIERLERAKDRRDGGSGISIGEQVLLNTLYARLELITAPKR